MERCPATGCPTWESEGGGDWPGGRGSPCWNALGEVNLSPLFDLTANFRSASSSTQLLHPHSVTCWKVPIPVGITVYLLTWGLGHLRYLVFIIFGGGDEGVFIL